MSQLIIGLLIVAISAIAVQRFELPILKFLEGYWFWWLRPLHRWFIKHKIAQANEAKQQFQPLAEKGIQALTD